jgi:hypothetical protein
VEGSGASEGANYHLFLTELCELLIVEKRRLASDKVHETSYTFDRPVKYDDEKVTTNRYSNSFVLVKDQFNHFHTIHIKK